MNKIYYKNKIFSVLLKTLFILGTPILIFLTLLIPIMFKLNLIVSSIILLPIIFLIFKSAKIILSNRNINELSKTTSIAILFLSIIHFGVVFRTTNYLISRDTRIASSIRNIASLVNAVNGIFLMPKENNLYNYVTTVISDGLRLAFKEAFDNNVGLLKHEKIFNFDVSFNDYTALYDLFSEVFIHRIYHFETKEKNPLIIDCGSNIGITLLYFKMLYPNSKIIAFEPDEYGFELLEKNVKDNNLNNYS